MAMRQWWRAAFDPALHLAADESWTIRPVGLAFSLRVISVNGGVPACAQHAGKLATLGARLRSATMGAAEDAFGNPATNRSDHWEHIELSALQALWRTQN